MWVENVTDYRQAEPIVGIDYDRLRRARFKPSADRSETTCSSMRHWMRPFSRNIYAGVRGPSAADAFLSDFMTRWAGGGPVGRGGVDGRSVEPVGRFRRSGGRAEVQLLHGFHFHIKASEVFWMVPAFGRRHPRR